MDKETLSEYAHNFTPPQWSPWGYIIDPRGEIYSLLCQSCHGVILAIIHPMLAKEAGFEPPDRAANVFNYQRFELDTQEKIPSMRISKGMLHDFSISYSEDIPITAEQRAALPKIIKIEDMSLDSKIETILHQTTMRRFLKELEN